MKREEEIDNAKNGYYKRIHEDGQYDDTRECVEEGTEWADANPKSPLISVNERLPPEEKDGLSIKVLVVSTKGKIDFSRYDYDVGGWISSVLDIEFTHWMPVPEPPKR